MTTLLCYVGNEMDVGWVHPQAGLGSMRLMGWVQQLCGLMFTKCYMEDSSFYTTEKRSFTRITAFNILHLFFVTITIPKMLKLCNNFRLTHTRLTALFPGLLG